ncbi:hypothetical protein GCM10008119_12240 [Pedobacter mendelii]|uniref:Transposase n=1 Tax=Pedobacter mendelii TaxID=1908240 RepID=A0ABQ2BGW1_9SPHI|nr:hypothetical protein GCM10008119_12240 [Pedobacter mendelii]
MVSNHLYKINTVIGLIDAKHWIFSFLDRFALKCNIEKQTISTQIISRIK